MLKTSLDPTKGEFVLLLRNTMLAYFGFVLHASFSSFFTIYAT